MIANLRIYCKLARSTNCKPLVFFSVSHLSSLYHPIKKCFNLPKRLFHCTIPILAKQKKSKSTSTDSLSEVKIPTIKSFEEQMDKRISRLTEEFSKLRAGKPSVDMLNHIYVQAYGSKIALTAAGQVSLKTSNKISISAFDPLLVPKIVEAIRDGGMNLNPSIEGTSVLVTIPKPSKETRELITKNVSKFADKTKQEIRQIRKEGMDDVKKLKGSISEDESRKLTKDIDGLTEKMIGKVDKAVKAKETEIMND